LPLGYQCMQQYGRVDASAEGNEVSARPAADGLEFRQAIV
jgi:hypothetical protein